MKLETPPKIIYKYTTFDRALKSIKKNYIWFSAPELLNDPCDCNIDYIDFKIGNSKLESILKQHVKGTRQQKRNQINYYKKNPHEFIKYYKIALKNLVNSSGIACFSTTNKEILMWAHYADNNQGICLGFNSRIDIDPILMKNVDYVSEDELNQIPYFLEKEKAFLKLYCRKSDKWRYEEEIRLFVFNKQGEISFDKSLLKEIILGYKVTSENINKIKNAIDKNAYNVTCYKSKYNIRKKSFEFEIV